MFEISYTNKFKKDLKRCERRGFPMKEFQTVVDLLKESGQLPPKYLSTS